jgi:hypothetical protein
MPSFLNSNPQNSKFNNYLSVCDLVNKYNLKNVNESPKLSKIILEFSSSNILSACESKNIRELDLELQIKAFFLLYILESQRPFVNLNKIKITKENGGNFSVKFILSSKDELNSVLGTVFTENWNLLLSEDFRVIKSSFSKFSQYIQENKRFTLNTVIPSVLFFELETLLAKKAFGLSSKNLNIRVYFVFEHKAQRMKKMCLDLVKNLPIFWVADKK